MSFFARCAAALRRFDERALFVGPRVALPPALETLLAAHSLVVADVGAAGAADPCWTTVRRFIRVLTFEPRPEEADGSRIDFPVCLGAAPGQGILHLNRYPEASSLYPVDMERMQDFAAREVLAPAGQISVPVDTLDHCLESTPGLRPDFLKLDVEGAELDVLRGAETALAQGVVGLRVEVSFVPRNVGAPLFGEVDAFLRQRGFELFSLSRELMIRRNRLLGLLSRPQLMWGDAVYFLGRRRFLERLAAAPQDRRELLLLKFVVVLLCHYAHDYALEIVEASLAGGWVPAPNAEVLREMVRRAARTRAGFVGRVLAGALLALLVYLAVLPFRDPRRQATYYLRARFGYLFGLGWRTTAQSGEFYVRDAPW